MIRSYRPCEEAQWTWLSKIAKIGGQYHRDDPIMQQTALQPAEVAASLGGEQFDFFARHGYLPWRRILEDGEIAQLRDEYDHVFREAREADTYRNLSLADES